MTHSRPIWGVVVCLLAAFGTADCILQSGDDGGGNPVAATLTVTIDPSGTGTGIVTSDPAAIHCEPDCSATFTPPRMVTLSAVPDPGSEFTGWSGDCSGTNPDFDLDLRSGANACTARFDELPDATLLITEDPAGTGTGNVSASGIDCGSSGTDCTETYPFDTPVTLTVTPDPNATFAGWGGDCAGFGTDPAPTLNMDGDKTCTVRFDLTLPPGLFEPHASYILGDFRAEAAALEGTTILVASFDGPPDGEIVDFSDIDNPTSPAGAEFSPCSGARGAIVFFDPNSAYNQDVFYSTSPNRCATITPATGGFTQLEFPNYGIGGRGVLGL